MKPTLTAADASGESKPHCKVAQALRCAIAIILNDAGSPKHDGDPTHEPIRRSWCKELIEEAGIDEFDPRDHQPDEIEESEPSETAIASPATTDEPIVVQGREVNVQSKWLGGDPPFVVTDGKLECLDERGDWSDILHEAKIFSTHESAHDFASACADKPSPQSPSSIAEKLDDFFLRNGNYAK